MPSERMKRIDDLIDDLIFAAGWFVMAAMALLIAFVVAVAGVAATYLFLTRTFMGTAIRAISQDRQIMPLMGVDARRIYLIASALGGALAGLAACLLVLGSSMIRTAADMAQMHALAGQMADIIKTELFFDLGSQFFIVLFS